ncbi:bifunctional 3'-5' exonuclease/DNA polymerase, partial [Actinoplanes siamensis]
MLVAVLPDGRLQDLHADGRPAGAPHQAPDLPAAIAVREAAEQPRWVWPATAGIYPVLLRAGVRVARCHDLELTEALLLGHAGRWGEPRGLAAATARLRGLPVPPDRARPEAEPPGFSQGALFEASAPLPVALEDLIEVYADQQRRLAATEHPGRFRM